MDLEHLEHAGFDPEAAAYEDGNDAEDLGYDTDIESGATTKIRCQLTQAGGCKTC